jgi:YfiH family protein
MFEVISAANLQDLPGIRHGFFTRQWGNCGLSPPFDLGDGVRNRGRVAVRLSLAADQLLSCYQIHSPDVVTVTKIWNQDDRPRADAMVTTEKKLALGILSADCVPVLFADVGAGVIGGAHAGWRGAISGVIENTLEAMEKKGANRKSTHVAIGPCIWQNSYEVGPEFPAPFLAESPDNEKFFRSAFRSGRMMFNLPAYIEGKLRRLEVGSVEPSPADTSADESRFFSYRRNMLHGISRTESLISVIVLAD